MRYAVDTNVLLDVLFRDEEFHEKSRKRLEKASENGVLIISPEVYSELFTAFSEKLENPKEELDKFLESKGIQLENHSKDSLKKAGEAWKKYDSTNKSECPKCGEKNSFNCRNCGETINWRNHLITDFMIGSHAEEFSKKLITRDRGFYSSYFDLEIDDPSK